MSDLSGESLRADAIKAGEQIREELPAHMQEAAAATVRALIEAGPDGAAALAAFNLLPFPPLDGGRIAVVLVEAVRRRRLPAEREALIYLAGFAVLIALVILISINDIQRLITGG